MTIANTTEKLFIWFAQKVNPAFVSASIAAAKGIFRPIFTLSDKKQDKDTKRYAAIREGLTEGIAIPVYLASGKIADKIAIKMAKPKEMAKDLFKEITNTKVDFDMKKLAGTSFESLTSGDISTIQKNYLKLKGSLSMLGVFASALVIIPALCSLSIKPIMKTIQKKPADTNDVVQTPVQKSSFDNKVMSYNNENYGKLNSLTKLNSYNPGMKVGAL